MSSLCSSLMHFLYAAQKSGSLSTDKFEPDIYNTPYPFSNLGVNLTFDVNFTTPFFHVNFVH